MNRAEPSLYGAALLVLLVGSGCGPTSEEIGASVLTAAPFVLFACSALLWTVWRPLIGPGATYPWRTLFRSVLVSLVGPVIGVPVLYGTGDSETPILALVTYGTAVLAIAIVVWHLLRLTKVERPVERALLGVYWILTLPAFFFLLDDIATSNLHAAFLVVWVYAGWLGSVPAVLMVLTWIGTGIRNAARGQVSAPVPAPVPKLDLAPIVPVVLIGGRSRRFGRDKLREPLASGGVLVDQPIAALRSVFGPRVVGVGPAHSDVLARIDRHLADAWEDAGPAGGLLTALDAFDAPVFLLSGDLPKITGEAIRAVLVAAAAVPQADAVLASSVGPNGERQPEPCIGLYRPGLRRRLRARLEAGQRKLADLPERPEYVALDPATLAGANTPEDLSR